MVRSTGHTHTLSLLLYQELKWTLFYLTDEPDYVNADNEGSG